jgi:hypothetical protein
MDNQLTASKQRQQQIPIFQEESYHQPRRSKRLESRHSILMAMSQEGGFQQDDELC